MYQFDAMILRWIDGDTCRVSITIEPFGLTITENVRVKGIDAPPSRSKDEAEKTKGINAKTYAESLAPIGTVVQLTTDETRPFEKYGRLLAKIALPDGHDFGVQMLNAGHAEAWDGAGPRPVVAGEG